MSKTFIDAFLEHTKYYESPTSFWKWSAFATIAATLRDHVYLGQGDRKLYPNIYTLFLAGSGQRKGFPVELSERLVREVATLKVISGRTSVQALIIDLAASETDKNNKVQRGGSAIFYAPELTAAIVSDPSVIGILTDLYEFKKIYDRNLSSGKIRLENVILNMFVASNEALLKEVYDVRALQGGLLARTFVVIPNEFRPSNSLLSLPDLTGSWNRTLIFLKEITKLNGQMTFSPDAALTYDSWYMSFRESLRGKEDRTGVLSRIHDSIKKLSMIISANKLELIIDRASVEEAIEEAIALLPNYSAFAMSNNGKSTIGEAAEHVFKLLAAAEGPVERKRFLREHYMYYDSEILDKLISHADQAGMIQVYNPMAGGARYELTLLGKETLGLTGYGKKAT